MRFQRNLEAGEALNALIGGGSSLLYYNCRAGDWQFCIVHDTEKDYWTATWQPHHLVPGKRYSSQPCEPLPPGVKFIRYPTQLAAEQACERKYKELRANN